MFPEFHFLHQILSNTIVQALSVNKSRGILKFIRIARYQKKLRNDQILLTEIFAIACILQNLQSEITVRVSTKVPRIDLPEYAPETGR